MATWIQRPTMENWSDNMKMAKASQADLNMAMDLTSALDLLGQRFVPCMPQAIESLAADHESEPFDRDDDKQCGRALRHLLEIADRASLMRVVFGCAVMLDPRNALVDPTADTIEHHPDTVAARSAMTAQPIEKWHEDTGPVLWWKFPIDEPPWCGTPNCSDWPGDRTHWTPVIVPEVPSAI